jgi:hypothetical protein
MKMKTLHLKTLYTYTVFKNHIRKIKFDNHKLLGNSKNYLSVSQLIELCVSVCVGWGQSSCMGVSRCFR